ncbi:hypothetical protein Glove_19g224 [Diversispora epigaea]|uniref:Uncharacterized protein n=1 Tax=Diversispora epigaea TaxID=1348612 RepID=A0A397JSB6_9GLOM|nr:hypothetical protein Glove_19g224 [Diversispora epigaea]
MEVDEKNPYPDWAKSPKIIFGKPEGLNIEKDDFGDDVLTEEDDFGDDVLTEGEVKAYNEKMGYEY